MNRQPHGLNYSSTKPRIVSSLLDFDLPISGNVTFATVCEKTRNQVEKISTGSTTITKKYHKLLHITHSYSY